MGRVAQGMQDEICLSAPCVLWEAAPQGPILQGRKLRLRGCRDLSDLGLLACGLSWLTHQPVLTPAAFRARGRRGGPGCSPRRAGSKAGDVLAVASARCQLVRKPHEGSSTRSSLPRPPPWLRLMVGTRGGQGSQGPFMCI